MAAIKFTSWAMASDLATRATIWVPTLPGEPLRQLNSHQPGHQYKVADGLMAWQWASMQKL